MSLNEETFEGTETEAGEPAKQHDRSAFGTLAALADNPLEQARKLVKYLKSSEDRNSRLTKLCSEKALGYAREANPELF